jgi:hypothetical protein
MRVKLQLVMCSDDGREETVADLVTLKKDATRVEHLGLSLKEAKQLLTTMGFFAQPPDRVYSRDSTNKTHVGVPLVAKIKMTTSHSNRLYLHCPWTHICSDLITLGRLLDYSTGFQLEFCENNGSLLLTFAENILGLCGNNLITSGSA